MNIQMIDSKYKNDYEVITPFIKVYVLHETDY